jgi:hypothetical protein
MDKIEKLEKRIEALEKKGVVFKVNPLPLSENVLIVPLNDRSGDGS